MDSVAIVSTLPPDVLNAVTAYRMLTLQSDIDKQALREANSMFVTKAFGGQVVDELQRHAAKSDANHVLALVNLAREVGKHAEEIDTILAEWRKLQPKLFA